MYLSGDDVQHRAEADRREVEGGLDLGALTTSQSCDRGGRSTLRQLGVDNSPPAWRAINTLTARPGEDQQL
jgi:hypothetical protein